MKKLLLILALIAAPVSSFAQGAFIPPQIAFKNINGIVMPIANATITVCTASASGIPCSPVLVGSIFKDAGLTQALSNPFTADANGNYQFAAAAATYTVTVTAAGFAGSSYQVSLGGSGSGGGTVTAASFASAFVSIQNNPILAPTGGEGSIYICSTFKIGSTFHAYYMYQLSGVGVIGHATSPDGINWTRDTAHNPVLNVESTGTWDASEVGTPLAWVENGSFNMLFQAYDAGSNGRVGYATSPDGLNWTRWSGNNCGVTTGIGCVMDVGLSGGDSNPIEATGIIKVGATYHIYLNHETRSLARAAGNATSTNLTTWTKDPNNPTFTGGYYDASAILLGGFFYKMIAHYVAGGTNYGDIELYRDTAPTFYSSSRVFLGAIKQNSGVPPSSGAAQWDAFALDTPVVVTDDVTRSTFTGTNNELWMIYTGFVDAGHVTAASGLAISRSVPAAPVDTIGEFPQGVQTPWICMQCGNPPIVPATGGGLTIGVNAINATPYQLNLGTYRNTGASGWPILVGNSAGDLWGIGPASTAVDNVIQLGNAASASVVFSATNDMVWNAKGYSVTMTATAALTAGQVVKLDAANANSVVVATTADTGAGIAIGIVQNSPGAAGSAFVTLNGIATFPLLGTGTCSLAQFVIVDTTTNGRVQCTSSYTAGTVIGKALTAQAAVGSAVTVLVEPR